MVNIIVELSKYIMIVLMTVYTYLCFSIFGYSNPGKKKRLLRRQNWLMFLIHAVAFMVMLLETKDMKILMFYLMQVVLFGTTIILYTLVYPRVSRLVVNNMCMLLCIGMIMLTRLDYTKAFKQYIIAAGAIGLSLVIPVIIRKFSLLSEWRLFYGIAGIVMLAVVVVIGRVSYGAMLGFTIAGINIQPSELVKIIFVFFVASSFKYSLEFKNIVLTTALAAFHVLILVVSKDLGAALIIFVVYLTMLYVATHQPLYLLAGIGSGSVASVLAYHLFDHVKTRVVVWKDPFACYDEGGYQVAQSLFAIGTGGWFGMGLYQGMPDKIPLGSSDFVFASISEELGGAFAVCIVLVCFSCFLMFLNIAMQIRDQFYKLIALGLGCVYGVQVFLNVGGVIKFIPSTGLTLPLVSYGGSSILCTIIMFAIIQGLYIMRQDEEGESNEQKSRGRKQKRDYSKKKVNGVRSQQKPKIKSGQTGYRGHESGSGRPRGGASSRFDEDEIEEIW